MDLKDSIIKLASALVQIPSRAGIDDMEVIHDFLKDWLERKGIQCNLLNDSEGKQVGLFLHIRSKEPGPALCLNACLDTAGFGDESRWQHPPTSGIIKDGFLYGRGSADSKIAVSLFSHLAVLFQQKEGLPAGDLFIVFDSDEHSGNFQGIRSFLEASPRNPDSVIIGYPGNDKLIIGSRGFLRAEVTVFGISAHSGSSSQKGRNAVLKMAELIQLMHRHPLPTEEDPRFGIGPKVTVTEVRGGEGFNLVPDRCTCKIDFRLTPNVDRKVAEEWIYSVVNKIGKDIAVQTPPKITWKESWPAFYVPVESPLVSLFLEAANQVFDHEILPAISGPSNIGNFLASKGIQTLSGFGVSYSNIHATDESVDIDTILPVYDVYRRAIENIMQARLPENSPSDLFGGQR